MPGRLDFDVELGGAGRRRDEREPMRLLLLGDFSGAPSTERPPLANRQTRRVDFETLDDVVHWLAPRVQMPTGEIRFERIDDFHPDQLFARVDLFQTLRHARANPTALTNDIGDLLGKPAESAAPPAPAGATGGIEALIRRVVAPYVVKDTESGTRAYLTAVDAAISGEMRALLHAPAFQSLESAWRGVQWLVSSLELGDELQLHLLDVTREELLADFASAESGPTSTGLHQAVVDRTRNVPGGHGWSAVVGLFRFGQSDHDIGLLGSLGVIASKAGGPFLADADLALVAGDAPASAAWHRLRRSEAARWIGLAAPRVLVRMPYGKVSNPIEAFAFEEIVGEPGHEQLLWGHASMAAALLIGRAFTARGWEMEPGDEREIDDLPAYTFVRDGERELQPCTERLLTETLISTMLQAGLLPIAGRRNANTAVAVRFQSVADPPAPLAWSRRS
jgi:type VI secretion system ImpC/EvpB family protein/type VI secretion system ImpB/VipA family protein